MREIFAACDTGSKGALSLDELWRALGMLNLAPLLLDGLAGDCGRPLSNQPLDGRQRELLRSIAAGESMEAGTFLRMMSNLWNHGGYDGAVSFGPGVDAKWAITRYRFRSAGEHTISWHGLEHFAGCAPSNTLIINVMPRLPRRQPQSDVLPGRPPQRHTKSEFGHGRSHIEVRPKDDQEVVRSHDQQSQNEPIGTASQPEMVQVVHPLRKFHYGRLVSF